MSIEFTTLRAKPGADIAPYWTQVRIAHENYERQTGESTEGNLILIALGGHPNQLHILRDLLEDVTGCPCGASELCADDIDTPERVQYREALTELLTMLQPA